MYLRSITYFFLNYWKCVPFDPFHFFNTYSFPDSSVGEESARNVGDLGLISGWEDPLEKEKANYSSILVWIIS